MTGKYRAKRKHDGEWVYGFYVDYYRGTMIMSPLVIGEGINTVVETPVDPDTLSRCSGLTACGQEVYEGDIVRLHIDHTAEFWTAVVRFGCHACECEYGWYLEPIWGTVFAKAIGAWLGERPVFGSTAAVIGNVWDNPEMMEEKV